jgi:methionine synthase II (cobalamin-independent)
MGPAIVITRTILIEDLVSQIPESVSYLLKKGIKCLACGEPVWGTLEEAAREEGFSDADLESFVVELQALSIQRDQ